MARRTSVLYCSSQARVGCVYHSHDRLLGKSLGNVRNDLIVSTCLSSYVVTPMQASHAIVNAANSGDRSLCAGGGVARVLANQSCFLRLQESQGPAQVVESRENSLFPTESQRHFHSLQMLPRRAFPSLSPPPPPPLPPLTYLPIHAEVTLRLSLLLSRQPTDSRFAREPTAADLTGSLLHLSAHQLHPRSYYLASLTTCLPTNPPLACRPLTRLSCPASLPPPPSRTRKSLSGTQSTTPRSLTSLRLP